MFYRPPSMQLLLHIWMPNELQYHSKSCYVCFYFHSKCIPDVNPPPTDPFPKKARTGFKCYKVARAACSSLKTLSPWVSLAQPTRYHEYCFITLSTCYCVRPLNERIKVFLSPFVWENRGFFANQTWGHFCLWPPEPPMNLVDLLHPQELMYVL